MNKRLLVIFSLAAAFTAAFSQSVCPVDLSNNKLRGKEIYVPKDLQGMDLHNPDSKWSYHRLCCTDNLAVFGKKVLETICRIRRNWTDTTCTWIWII